MKLVQKAFLKGTREFEIVDDVIHVRIKKLFSEERLTVGLSTLNPEPVINKPFLEFHGRSKRGPLLVLLLNEPNADDFNAFVDTLKQRIPGDDHPFADIEAVSPETSRSEALGWNVYEEPPGFWETDEAREKTRFQPASAERLAGDITMLKTYLDENNIRPLLDALEELKAEPHNEAAFQKIVDAYNDLGAYQGAILTYAPYLKVLLSKYLWS